MKQREEYINRINGLKIEAKNWALIEDRDSRKLKAKVYF